MVAPWKPWLVTSTMPPIPAEAEAPPDLVTPATASAAASASRARVSSTSTSGMSGSRRSSAGNVRASSAAIGQPGEAIFRRRARHGDRALGQRVEAVALEIIGRNHRLLVADEHAQPEIVALGALRFLDGAVAHVDRKRYRAHGQRVGLIGAGAPRGGDETFGEIGEVGLVEK